VKDLDFEEIDRAVNSVISNGPSNDSNHASQPIDNSTSTEYVEPESQPVVTAGVPRPPVARRSSGQFMDVVHPSSDMRRPIAIPERPTQTVPLSEPKPAEAFQTQLSVDTEPTAPATIEPEAMPYEDADIDKLSSDIDMALGKTTDASLESPFISGTKVEKRPLGAFSDDSVSETAEQPNSDVQSDFAPQPVTSENEMLSPGQAPLPAELQNDLLKIEADSSTMPEEVAIPEQPAVTETDVAPADSEKPEVIEANDSSGAVESPRDVAEKTEPAGPTSIVQQYTEKPNTGDQSTGAIYDTESYHKTLAHPAKKKSGWMWVLYIVILLIVGAGVGVALHYFVIPMLSSL